MSYLTQQQHDECEGGESFVKNGIQEFLTLFRAGEQLLDETLLGPQMREIYRCFEIPYPRIVGSPTIAMNTDTNYLSRLDEPTIVCEGKNGVITQLSFLFCDDNWPVITISGYPGEIFMSAYNPVDSLFSGFTFNADSVFVDPSVSLQREYSGTYTVKINFVSPVDKFMSLGIFNDKGFSQMSSSVARVKATERYLKDYLKRTYGANVVFDENLDEFYGGIGSLGGASHDRNTHKSVYIELSEHEYRGDIPAVRGHYIVPDLMYVDM